MKIVATLGVLLCMGAAPVWAESISPITPQEVAQLQAKIKSLESEATARRAQAAEALAARNAACYKKVLVSACLDQSRKDDVNARLAIRQLDAESRRLQREIRLREAATKQAESEAAATKQDAEAAEKAARNREETARRETEFQRREAEHQKQLEAGKVRAGQDAQARARRDEEQRRDQAKKEAAARERTAHPPPPATSGTKPYTPPTIDIPAAPSSIGPKR